MAVEPSSGNLVLFILSELVMVAKSLSGSSAGVGIHPHKPVLIDLADRINADTGPERDLRKALVGVDQSFGDKTMLTLASTQLRNFAKNSVLPDQPVIEFLSKMHQALHELASQSKVIPFLIQA